MKRKYSTRLTSSFLWGTLIVVWYWNYITEHHVSDVIDLALDETFKPPCLYGME